MNSFSRKLVASLLAAAQVAAPALAHAGSFEYKPAVPGLVVTSPATMPTNPPTSTSLEAALQLSTSTLAFGNVNVGASGQGGVRLTNVGTAVLTLTQAPTLAGDSAFSVTGTNCPTSLAPGAWCDTSLTFTPSQGADVTGSLSFFTNAATGPATVALAGTGMLGRATLAVASGSSADFGTVAVGDSQQESFVFSNTGNKTLTVTHASTSGNAAVTVASSTCESTTLTPGATCSVTVAYAPTQAQAMSASLSVTSSAANSPATLNLQGVGTTGAAASTSASSLDFGYLNKGAAAPSQAVQLLNTGGIALTISAVNVTGSDAGAFSATTDCGASLAAASSCTVNVSPDMNAAGLHGATLTFVTSAGTRTVALNSVVETLAATSALFVGKASGTLTLTGAHVGLTDPAIVRLYAGATLAATSTSVGYATASKTLTANFGTPPAAGVYTVRVYDGAGQQIAVTVTEVYTATGSLYAASNSSANFGVVPVGSAQTASFIFTNTGTGPLSGVAASVSGNAALTLVNNYCGSAGSPGTLVAGGSCNISVRYAPTQIETLSAVSLAVNSSAVNSPSTVALSGSATAQAVATLETSALAFGNVNSGDTTNVQTVKLTNTGNLALSITGSTLGGTAPGAFSKSSTCGSSLAPSASCTTTVSFLPAAAGSYAATLTFATGAGDQVVALGGTAYDLSVTQSLLAGQSSSNLQLTVSGSTSLTGPATLRLLNGASVVATAGTFSWNSGTRTVNAMFDTTSVSAATYTAAIYNASGSVIATASTTVGAPPVGEITFNATAKAGGTAASKIDTFTWTAPANVTSVSVVAVGGGCLGGGGLGWKNNIAVTPGQTYTVVVGRGAPSGASTYPSTLAGTSYFIDNTTVAGKSGSTCSTGGTYVGDGGGNGGAGGSYASSAYAGGGAGGYTGDGGRGTTSGSSGSAGAGGGGGGGGRLTSGYVGGGGGVGLLGQGANGAAGTSSSSSGKGGSAGANGTGPGASAGAGGAYGGGQGYNNSLSFGSGGDGAVRIIWGPGRSFPSNAS